MSLLQDSSSNKSVGCGHSILAGRGFMTKLAFPLPLLFTQPVCCLFPGAPLEGRKKRGLGRLWFANSEADCCLIPNKLVNLEHAGKIFTSMRARILFADWDYLLADHYIRLAISVAPTLWSLVHYIVVHGSDIDLLLHVVY